MTALSGDASLIAAFSSFSFVTASLIFISAMHSFYDFHNSDVCELYVTLYLMRCLYLLLNFIMKFTVLDNT